MKKQLRANSQGKVWPYQNVLVGDKVKVTLPDGRSFIGIVADRYEGDCGYTVRTSLEIAIPNRESYEHIAIWTDRIQPKIKVLKHNHESANS